MHASEVFVSSLAWNHASTVGVQAMDDQHGILMDTLNELRIQLMRGVNREQIRMQLGRLVEFTGMHFDCEERLLERYGFPGLAEHRKEHQRLMHAIREAVERAEHGQSEELHPSLGVLRSCYVQHVEGLDRQYGAWLNELGIY
jgi:hemerythrin